MFRITYAEVVANAHKAFSENRLSAQGPAPAASYRDTSGRPCAIGASLDDDLADECDGLEIKGGASVLQLASRGIITFPSDDELRQAVQLQRAHDKWAKTQTRVAKRHFEDLIGWTAQQTSPSDTPMSDLFSSAMVS